VGSVLWAWMELMVIFLLYFSSKLTYLTPFLSKVLAGFGLASSVNSRVLVYVPLFGDSTPFLDDLLLFFEDCAILWDPFF
jgi:hypothetical protein